MPGAPGGADALVVGDHHLPGVERVEDRVIVGEVAAVHEPLETVSGGQEELAAQVEVQNDRREHGQTERQAYAEGTARR